MPDEALTKRAEPLATGITSAAAAGFRNAPLAAVLLTLHGSIAWGNDEWWARGLLLAHFGLFLIWQPVWRGARRIPLTHALLVMALGALFAFAADWWLVAAWMAALFGLIGGGVPATVARGERFAAIVAAVYLVAMLLMWVLPHIMLDEAVIGQVEVVARYGMLLLLAVIIFVPGGARVRDAPVIIDLFYTVMLFLLVVVLALGSFVILQQKMIRGEGDYLLGVVQVLMLLASLLFGLSWLWNPRAGFSGIGALLSRYLLGLGLPFEQRMRRLAELAETETRPEHFLRAALTDMLDLPWISGYAWLTAASSGEVGKVTDHAETHESAMLQLTMYSTRALSPAILLHQKLLIQMVGHFYEALRREQQRQRTAYSRAIFETGARLTHDVKNLLQSLHSICAAAEMRGADDIAFRALVQRQLPQVAQRLAATLDKLKAPESAKASELAAALWWQGLQYRYTGRAVIFVATTVPPELRLPAELFDSVADTLIENALYKVAEGSARRVSVSLLAGPQLRVCDDGTPVPDALADELFHAPVSSDSGLGVGLYQAAAYAGQSGYALGLAVNRPGEVCFELMRRR